jgi:hypothetical protein
MCLFGDIGIPFMKKVTEFREIPRNFTELYVTEFGGIPPELQPIPHEYGIDGSKKNRRNSVSAEFRGHPSYEARLTFGPKWHSLRSLPFQGPKSLDF